jgi:hypothetical protein
MIMRDEEKVAPDDAVWRCRFQGMLVRDAFAALSLPLLIYFVSFGLLIEYMKSRKLDEINDFIVYGIFLLGALPAFPVLRNFWIGVCLDPEKMILSFPLHWFFRKKIPLAAVDSLRFKTKTYYRSGAAVAGGTRKFSKFLLVLKCGDDESTIVFNDPEKRLEVAEKLSLLTGVECPENKRRKRARGKKRGNK